MEAYGKDLISHYLEWIAVGLEVLGVAVLLIGTVLSLAKYVFNKQESSERSFKVIRKDLGRSIILGLEILIAADIIGTIIYDMTMDNILKLGMVVLIRTFLSFALEIEIEGRLPWKRNGDNRSV